MQLHVTSNNPALSAERLWENPIRARKMIVETQQLIACAQIEFGHIHLIRKTDGSYFKTGWKHHPVCKWVCANEKHLLWCVEYLEELYKRYSGPGFNNVRNNIDIVKSQIHTRNYEGITFLNFAKSKAKGLDFTDRGVFEAYNKYLEAQGEPK